MTLRNNKIDVLNHEWKVTLSVRFVLRRAETESYVTFLYLQKLSLSPFLYGICIRDSTAHWGEVVSHIFMKLIS